MSVWNPDVEAWFKRDIATYGTQSALTEWRSPEYELDTNEVVEIRRIELIPPVNTATNLKRVFREIGLYIGDEKYPHIIYDQNMAPHEGHLNAGISLNLGIPYLWRPIIGRLPTPEEGTCPKVKRGDRFSVYAVPTESVGEDYAIAVRFARCRTLEKLREVLAVDAIPIGFRLNTDVYTRAAVPVGRVRPRPGVESGLDLWDELPGGLRQPKPQIFPWVTWSWNRKATTPNQWYEFTLRPENVYFGWQVLQWNLVDKMVAYLVDAIAVWPHANSRDARLWVSGRATNPEYLTRLLPEPNYFMPPSYTDTTIDEDLKRAGPRKLVKPFLFHGVLGGIQIRDNGTSIPADMIKVGVWGRKFILK